jgi:hypothetical protein
VVGAMHLKRWWRRHGRTIPTATAFHAAPQRTLWMSAKGRRGCGQDDRATCGHERAWPPKASPPATTRRSHSRQRQPPVPDDTPKLHSSHAVVTSRRLGRS